MDANRVHVPFNPEIIPGRADGGGKIRNTKNAVFIKAAVIVYK